MLVQLKLKSTSLANFVNWHWLNTMLDVENVAVELVTVTPLDVEASVPPEANVP